MTGPRPTGPRLTRPRLTGPRAAVLLHLCRGPWKERLELSRVLVLTLLAEVGLRRTRLPWLCRRFGVTLDLQNPAAAVTDDLTQLPRWVRRHLMVVGLVMQALPTDGPCLRYALVVGHRTRSLSPVLRIGARRPQQQWQMHAWVEVQGVAINAGDYQAFLGKGMA